MTKSRLEAFSDGVLAIIITIMVLELKVPHDPQISGLLKLWPVFLSYVLSFVYVGIYWNNHHHLFQIARSINGRVLWANMHLLFWLSLVPFATGWMGENHFADAPVALYGCVMFMAGLAYYFLARALVSLHGPDSEIAKAIGRDRKGKLSLVIYTLAVVVAFVWPIVASIAYWIVAAIWFIPDKRIEKTIERK
jgi:uncharacterized membrane protein